MFNRLGFFEHSFSRMLDVFEALANALVGQSKDCVLSMIENVLRLVFLFQSFPRVMESATLPAGLTARRDATAGASGYPLTLFAAVLERQLRLSFVSERDAHSLVAIESARRRRRVGRRINTTYVVRIEEQPAVAVPSDHVQD